MLLFVLDSMPSGGDPEGTGDNQSEPHEMIYTSASDCGDFYIKLWIVEYCLPSAD